MGYGIDMASPASTDGLLEVIREKQAGQSQVAFAARLGIKQSELSRFLNGKKGLTKGIAAGLIRAYPDLRDLVVDAMVGESSAAA